MKNRFPREFYIPKGAVKVSDKLSTAVAYVYDCGNGPAVMGFHGKADKPDFRYWYGTTAKRDAKVASHFQAVRATEQRRRDAVAKRKAFVHDYKVGEVLNTCWGYEQTNVEYFEITAVIGKHVELREIASEERASGHMSGNTAPMVGQYIGKPIRRLAQEGKIKIDDVRTAWRTEFKTVAGIKVYRDHYVSSYH